MKRSGVTALFLLGVIVSVSSQMAFATVESLNWGDYTGITIKYIDVTESSATDTLNLNGDGVISTNLYNGLYDGLYSKPTLSGDSLQFDKLNFFSSSSGNASDITDGKLAGTIEAKPNSFIDKIRFQEWGDVTIIGAPTNYASASVTNSFFIKVKEIDNQAIAEKVFTVNMVINPSNGNWTLSDDGTVLGQGWAGDLYVDVTGLLRAAGITTGMATLLDFTMDNTLATASADGSSAYIAKKETDGLRITSINIPEPMTMAILGFGGLLLARKRK